MVQIQLKTEYYIRTYSKDCAFLQKSKHRWKGSLVAIIFSFKGVFNETHNIMVRPGQNEKKCDESADYGTF